MMNNLPQELLINILLRLPVKSLMRFKSVSKLWRSLISDPRFANSHFHRSSLLPHHRLLHITDSQVIRSLDFHSSFYDDSAVIVLHFPIIPPPCYLQIMGSCRGFVLLDDYHNLFVWNPSTGSCKSLPYFPMSSQCFPFIHGFGYDASNDDYLVVLAAYNPSDGNYASDSQFFSMKANSWKKIEEGTDFPYMNAIDEPRAGWFLNGAIHWLAFRHDTSLDLILAFNVTDRKFMEIPLLEDFYGNLEFCYLGTLGECLSLCELGDDTANIWLMKEYGMKSSWTKSILVSLVHIPSNFFVPIGFTPSGKIVGTDGSSGLVRCNDKGEVIELRSYGDRSFKAVTYTETLLSLPCNNEQVREGDTQQW